MVDNFYTQFDEYVELYNNKFAIPATNIRQKLMDMGKIRKPISTTSWTGSTGNSGITKAAAGGTARR